MRGSSSHLIHALAPASLLVFAAGCATPMLAPVMATASGAQTSASTDNQTWRDRLVDPITAPTLFESPVIESNIEPMFVGHTFPSDSIFGGGGYNVIALQIRYAINERLAFIATKDGWIDLDPDAGGSETGLADIGAGLKYAWIDDPVRGLLVTPGFTFELSTGDEDVFQGNGSGLLRPFISFARVLDRIDILGNAGYSFPFDSDEESSSLDYHLHASYEVSDVFSPLIELNGITYTGDGDTLPVDFEGGDLINLGSDDVSGNTIFTGALGFRWRATPHLMVGASFEVPLGSREDLFNDRFMLDLIIH